MKLGGKFIALERRCSCGSGLSLLILCLLLAPMIGAAPKAGEVITIDGILHVRNGADPSDGLQTIKATELWRIGGEDDELFFGTIGQVLGDNQGNLYLLDTQLSEVKVISPDGAFLRTLSREGDGPGEIRNAISMYFHADSILGLIQTFPGKVVKIGIHGVPAGTISYSTGDAAQGQFAVLIQGIVRGGNFLLAGIKMGFGSDGTNRQTYFLSQCDDGGKERHCYVTRENTINFANFVLNEADMDFIWGRFDLTSDGSLYVAPYRNQYVIHVYSPDGTLTRAIEREYQSWQRTEKDTQVARQTIEAYGRNYPIRPREVNTLDIEPDITGIRLSSDGELWVGTSRGERDLAEGTMIIFDVFDTEGHYRAKKALMIPGDARQDALFFPSPGRVVVVKSALDTFLSGQGVTGGGPEEEAEEEQPLEVICYALEE